MEPFEIQPDDFVEKQKEVIAQLTNENILLTCRIDQLEKMWMDADAEIAVYQRRADEAEARLSELEKDPEGWDVT